MKKVLVAPTCTDLNRGDQALVWQAVEFVRDVYGDDVVDCRIIDTGEGEEEVCLQTSQTIARGYKTTKNILPHPGRGNESKSVHYGLLGKMRMGVNAFFDFIRLGMIVVAPTLSKYMLRNEQERQSYKFIEECDSLFIKGGGFLHTYGKFHDFYYIWYQTYYIALALRLGIKVIILPNSFGPISSGLNKIYLRFLLGKCSVIYAREDISLRFLKSELLLDNVISAPDFGYFMPSFSCFEKRDAEKVAIAITVRPYRFPKDNHPNQKYNSYINEIVKYVVNVTREKGFRVDFVVQVKGPSAHENDRLAISDIMERLPLDVRSNIAVRGEVGDVNDLIKIYSEYNIVLGTRFHSVILSHVSSVKALAIAYGGNKAFGIMESLGLQDYVCDIYSVDSDLLLDKTDQLLSDDRYLTVLENKKREFFGVRGQMVSYLSNILCR